jgi:hypothetical protein
MTFRKSERGEGKVGCIISLIILVIAGAAGLKIIPVYYSNNNLQDAAHRKAETAAGREAPAMVKELQQEARNLEIAEALAPGAITINKVSSKSDGPGNVQVTLRYTRKVDLYGVTQLDIPTNWTINQPILENIR